MGGGRGCAPGVLLKVRATARTSCADKPARERYSGKFAKFGNPSVYGTIATSVARFCNFMPMTNEEKGETHLIERTGGLIYTRESKVARPLAADGTKTFPSWSRLLAVQQHQYISHDVYISPMSHTDPPGPLTVPLQCRSNLASASDKLILTALPPGSDHQVKHV